MSEQSHKICDECGRSVTKFHRIHKKHRYCTTCYKRVFKKRFCPKCGELALLPTFDPESTCKKCETAGPCARCGKESYQIGKITVYGPVCNSCSPYFREKKICEICGGLSSRLTKVTRMGHEKRLCPKCATADYKTCPACRRYRQLFLASDNRLLCKKCNEMGVSLCLTCNQAMPAGRGSQCENCYWTKTYRKRVLIDAAAFTSKKLCDSFFEFSDWLLETVGSHKAALNIHRYFVFFKEIDSIWPDIPSGTVLLRYFGTEKLRRFRLPMRWMNHARNIVLDRASKEQNSEKKRIESIIQAFPSSSIAGQILQKYLQILTECFHVNTMSIRSLRLALSPALALLRIQNSSGEQLPTQISLDKYLLKTPGQKAAITGFIHFLNNNYKLNLIIWIDKNKIKLVRQKELEKKLMSMMKQTNYETDFNAKWIQTSLEYFHKVRISKKKLLLIKSTYDSHGINIILEKIYWIPHWRHTTII